MTAFDIVLLGAGNVATHLAPALHRQGHRIVQVYSRTGSAAKELAGHVGADFTADIKALYRGADIYVCALKDDALQTVLERIDDFGQALWLHTSGSMPLSVLAAHTPRCGVLYPLQSFSKGRALDLEKVPFCLEAAQASDLTLMKELASSLSCDVREMSSEQRANLHVAAVFASNFANGLYAMAQEILAYDGIDFSILQALIEETAAKVSELEPRLAQTGPAVRGDRRVMERHLAWLKQRGEEEKAQVYRLMSDLIYERSRKQ